MNKSTLILATLGGITYLVAPFFLPLSYFGLTNSDAVMKYIVLSLLCYFLVFPLVLGVVLAYFFFISTGIILVEDKLLSRRLNPWVRWTLATLIGTALALIYIISGERAGPMYDGIWTR